MEITVAGFNRDDALVIAKWEIEMEYGYRYGFREVISEKFLRKVPPKKWRDRTDINYGPGYGVVREQFIDEKAPQNEWLELWQFELDYHV